MPQTDIIDDNGALQIGSANQPVTATQVAEPQNAEALRAEQLQSILDNLASVTGEVSRNQDARATKLSKASAETAATMEKANRNIEASESNVLTALQGIWNPDFDIAVQRKKKQDAATTLRYQTAVTDAATRADSFRLKAAKAPLEILQAVQKYKQGEVQFDLTQLELMSKDLQLQQDLAKIKQNTVTMAEARERATTGNYTPEITEAFVQKKLLNHEKLLNDVEASADARALGKMKLADHYESRALEKLDRADLQVIAQGEKQFGLKAFDLGKGRTLPMHAIKNRLAKLDAEEFKNEQALAARIDNLSQYATQETALMNDALSTALTTPSGEMLPVRTSAGEVLAASQGELLQMDIFNVMPSDVATAVYDVTQSRAVLNEALKSKTATAAQYTLHNKNVERMKEVTKQHTDDFISGVSKKRQPAFRRLVANRMVVDNPNQGAQILAETGLMMPNFKGNEALGKGFEQFVLQYAEQQGFSGKANAQDNSPAAQQARVDAMMAKFMAPDFSATTDHAELMKAVNQKSTDSIYSVKETILNEQAAKMFYSAMLTLGEADPDLKKLMFNADGSQTAVWVNEKGQISQKTLLVAMVNLGKQKYQDATYYVRPLNAALNKTLEANQQQMQGFVAPNAQSFVKMVFPFESYSTLVDRKLNKNLRITLTNAIHDANKPAFVPHYQQER